MAYQFPVVARDKFEPDEEGHMAIPCCWCKHRHGSDTQEPCRTCDHNCNAIAGNTTTT